ncbi:MAG: hypothetical protein LBD86_04515 [Spirochaetaceae bacterium]|jgi:hypothetical protein|nr:hypothetical protein [Spirochaetaceae bacterium]
MRNQRLAASFGMVNARCAFIAACVAGLLLSFVSCASTGAVKKDVKTGNEFAELPPGALTYIRFDVKPSRGLLDGFLTRHRLNTKTLKTFFDRTDTAVAAVYPKLAGESGTGTRRFLLAAYGKNYPAALSSFSLFFNPAWKKTRSVTGKKYWRSPKNGVSLFMQRDKARISDADPFFIEDGVETPVIFRIFSADADVSAWITKPDFLDKALARMDIPITIPATGLFISASAHEKGWKVDFRLETPGRAQARGLVSVLALVKNALDRAYIKDAGIAALARLLLSEPPSVDDNALILRCPAIPEATLAGLIASFSIQLNR